MPTIEQVSKRLISDQKWFVKWMIGGVLSLVPIVNFFAFGYLYRLFCDGRGGKDFELAEWRDWKELFIDGAKFAVIALVFTGLPLGVLFLISYSFPEGAFIMQLPLIPVIFLVGPLSCAALYLYLVSDDFKNCLNFNALAEILKRSFFDYLVPTLAFLGLLLMCWVVFPFAFFLGGLIYFYLMGQIFGRLEKGVMESAKKNG